MGCVRGCAEPPLVSHLARGAIIILHCSPHYLFHERSLDGGKTTSLAAEKSAIEKGRGGVIKKNTPAGACPKIYFTEQIGQLYTVSSVTIVLPKFKGGRHAGGQRFPTRNHYAVDIRSDSFG